ncbi:class I SAM-dependent methyltransferase [Paenibacillus cymbidii]|uniref:class I SAM-dependent methyltransferase n=1 Tax=Paenibacillus cymbidii TaxID=1639034 RepID=UPI0014369A10|nr:class I SAM-dependent methyltransferase [Paenibacillus cymbidii]
MEERIARIRKAEKTYHDACYDQYRLFEAGSWMHKPVHAVMANWERLRDREHAKVLDLGCGVGRNSIPLAQAMLPGRGVVVCVDLLDSALEKLVAYSEQYGVRERIAVVQSAIESFAIEPLTYDMTVAVSVLEHADSVDGMKRVMERIAAGTKPGGIAVVIAGTDIRETDAVTGESREAMFEVNVSADTMTRMLLAACEGWETLECRVSPQQFAITREERDVVLQSNCVVFTARKQYGS